MPFLSRLISLGKPPVDGGGSGALQLTLYEATLADCDNTTDKTTVLSASVPAADWTDGKIVQVRLTGTSKQNSGGNRNLQEFVSVGGVEVALDSQTAITASATVCYRTWTLDLLREGTDIRILPTATLWANIASASFTNGALEGTISGATLTGDIEITMSLQFGFASTEMYFHPLSGQVILNP